MHGNLLLLLFHLFTLCALIFPHSIFIRPLTTHLQGLILPAQLHCHIPGVLLPCHRELYKSLRTAAGKAQRAVSKCTKSFEQNRFCCQDPAQRLPTRLCCPTTCNERSERSLLQNLVHSKNHQEQAEFFIRGRITSGSANTRMHLLLITLPCISVDACKYSLFYYWRTKNERVTKKRKKFHADGDINKCHF